MKKCEVIQYCLYTNIENYFYVTGQFFAFLLKIFLNISLENLMRHFPSFLRINFSKTSGMDALPNIFSLHSVRIPCSLIIVCYYVIHIEIESQRHTKVVYSRHSIPFQLLRLLVEIQIMYRRIGLCTHTVFILYLILCGTSVV